ncbi:MAG TPA: IgGFc-binding protein, partial [Hanamia sp.]|nr:IgGFc-binding protein [Hanamia sp.]
MLLVSFATIHSWVFAQDFSNKGKDFWIGYGNHVRMFDNKAAEQMQVYITSDVSTNGYVEIPGIGFKVNFSVIANQISTIDIPRTAALTDEGLYNTGIHIVSDLPVVVYSFIYVSAISGATVCLPTNVLGREYYSVNYTQISNDPDSYSYFSVVATEDNTVVEITPAGNTKGGRAANVPFTVSLNRGQVYQVLGAEFTSKTGVDLTGSIIRSINTGSGCKRIAVF